MDVKKYPTNHFTKVVFFGKIFHMKHARNILALMTLALSIVAIVAGLLAGEGAVVLRKAVNICLECIGIG